MYHDIRGEGDFASWLRVSERHFTTHLEWLQGIGRFVTPDEALRPGFTRSEPPRFLLTFDDGYANNLRLALPILESYRVPALFFISTHAMQSQEPFWFDTVVTAIQAAELHQLDFRDFGLGLYPIRSGNEMRRWDDINRILLDLKALGDDDHAVVKAVLDSLKVRFSAVLDRCLPRHRPLRPDEVSQMSQSPICHIGSHSSHHRILTRASDEDLPAELTDSRRILEELCNKPVVDLAYPNGDFDDRVIAAATRAGYHRGYTTLAGAVTSQTIPMAIPRIGVDGVGPDWLLRYRLGRQFLSARIRPRQQLAGSGEST